MRSSTRCPGPRYGPRRRPTRRASRRARCSGLFARQACVHCADSAARCRPCSHPGTAAAGRACSRCPGCRPSRCNGTAGSRMGDGAGGRLSRTCDLGGRSMSAVRTEATGPLALSFMMLLAVACQSAVPSAAAPTSPPAGVNAVAPTSTAARESQDDLVAWAKQEGQVVIYLGRAGHRCFRRPGRPAVASLRVLLGSATSSSSLGSCSKPATCSSRARRSFAPVTHASSLDIS